MSSKRWKMSRKLRSTLSRLCHLLQISKCWLTYSKYFFCYVYLSFLSPKVERLRHSQGQSSRTVPGTTGLEYTGSDCRVTFSRLRSGWLSTYVHVGPQLKACNRRSLQVGSSNASADCSICRLRCAICRSVQIARLCRYAAHNGDHGPEN